MASAVRYVQTACTNRSCTPCLFLHIIQRTDIPFSCVTLSRLPDCGHTFCLSCLQNWFGTTHAHFVQAHPHWNINMMSAHIARMQGLLRSEYLHHPDIQNVLRQLQPAQPEYACPKCRKRIFRRPVEDYALKSLVRGISAANDAEKGDIPNDNPLVEHRRGHLVVVDTWEGYFPKES